MDVVNARLGKEIGYEAARFVHVLVKHASAPRTRTVG